MPEYKFEDYQLQKETNSTNDFKKRSPDDSDKWEMDVEATLDQLYHTWLGEKVVNGKWVEDPKINKRMNEKGASLLISEIRPRFNINSQFSVLTSDMIEDIASETSENIMRILKYDYWKYDIKYNDLVLICKQIFDSLYIWLNISLEGGMRMYKGDKTKTVINKQETNVAGGGAY